VGTRGIVVGDRFALDGRDDWGQLPTDPQPIVTGTFGCVESFLRAIVSDAPVAIPARDAFASLAACVAADASAATGRPAVPAGEDFD
jgi:predicted dehydrogenase